MALRRNITLQQRLRQYVGRFVQIEGQDLGLEPGLLQSVFRRNFIRVVGELFVPLSLNQITVLNVARTRRFRRAGVTTTFPSRFDDVQLVLIGRDFIELQVRERGRAGATARVLIPLNKVLRIFFLAKRRKR